MADATLPPVAAADPAARPGDRAPQVDALADLVKLSVDFRLVLVLVSLLYPVVGGPPRPLLVVALVAASLLGLVPLLGWDRVAGTLVRRPWWFLLDVVLTAAILLATGPDGPFALYLLGTAFLAGVLYGVPGGLVFGGGLVGFYLISLSALGPLEDHPFTVLVALPALALLGGVGAASVRGLLLRKAAAEAELSAAVRTAAASEERARLAREMHDSLGKTLHGIALTASALPGYVTRRPDEAVAHAEQVAHAAEVAAQEARLLIGDLRSDRLDAPLPEAVRRWSQEWAARTGHELVLRLDAVPPMSASTRYELFTILREALRNIAEHADATAVAVALEVDDDTAVLRITDDGVGMACADLQVLAADGHYGVLGMHERARRAGGTLAVDSGPDGTAVTVRIPLTSAHDMVRS